MRSKSLLVCLLLANVAIAAVLFPRSEPVSATEQAARPPLATKQLELVAEQTLAESAQEYVEPARQCRVWGPESDPAAFDELAGALDQAGGLPQIQESTVSGSPDRLVYVSQLNSRDQARQVAQELSAVGIESYLLDTDEGLRLSVGVFSQANRAEIQRDRVARLGYEVVVLDMPRSQTVYNLVAHVHNNHPSYESSTSSCTSIAQSR